MTTSVFAVLVAGMCVATLADETTLIPVTERGGIACVNAAELEHRAAIVVKGLPGSDLIVACSADRCARVRPVAREGKVAWVGAAELARALGFAARFSDDGKRVEFKPERQPSPGGDSVAGVGQLAPNFGLTHLDGGPISLADLRGKRVLIQSWGSW